MGLKLNIEDLFAIEVDLVSYTVKCLSKYGFILWQTRKHTKEEALEVQKIINKKKEAYLKSIS